MTIKKGIAATVAGAALMLASPLIEEIEGDAIAFYFNEINGSTQKRHYITHLDIDEEYTLKQVNELFENFEIIGIKYVMMTICVR